MHSETELPFLPHHFFFRSIYKPSKESKPVKFDPATASVANKYANAEVAVAAPETTAGRGRGRAGGSAGRGRGRGAGRGAAAPAAAANTETAAAAPAAAPVQADAAPTAAPAPAAPAVAKKRTVESLAIEMKEQALVIRRLLSSVEVLSRRVSALEGEAGQGHADAEAGAPAASPAV